MEPNLVQVFIRCKFDLLWLLFPMLVLALSIGAPATHAQTLKASDVVKRSRPLTSDAALLRRLHISLKPNEKFTLPCGVIRTLGVQIDSPEALNLADLPEVAGSPDCGSNPTIIIQASDQITVDRGSMGAFSSKVPGKRVSRIINARSGEEVPVSPGVIGVEVFNESDIQEYRSSLGTRISLKDMVGRLAGDELHLILRVQTRDWLVEERRLVPKGKDVYFISSPFSYIPRIGSNYEIKGYRPPQLVSRNENGMSWHLDNYEALLPTVQIEAPDPMGADLYVVPKDSAVKVHGSVKLSNIIVVYSGHFGIDVVGDYAHISNVTILNAATDGMNVVARKASIIENNSVWGSGRNGIVASGGHTSVLRNTVSVTGLSEGLNPTVAAVVTDDSASATVHSNRITDSGYSGLRVGVDSEVVNNTIVGACQRLHDCGAIYSWNRPHEARKTNLQVSNNLICDVGRPDHVRRYSGRDEKIIAGVYIDWGGNGVTVSNNTIQSVAQGVFVGNSRDIDVFGNIIRGWRDCEVCEDFSNDWPFYADKRTNRLLGQGGRSWANGFLSRLFPKAGDGGQDSDCQALLAGK